MGEAPSVVCDNASLHGTVSACISLGEATYVLGGKLTSHVFHFVFSFLGSDPSAVSGNLSSHGFVSVCSFLGKAPSSDCGNLFQITLSLAV